MKKDEVKMPITSSYDPAALSNPPAQYEEGVFYFSTGESTRHLVQKWFIDPLRKMDRDMGFIILIVLFSLYEKHLRHKYRGIFGERDNFSENHRIFEKIGTELNISKGNAYHFWQTFRNGVMHRAVPKKKSFKWQMSETGEPITVTENNLCQIDPLALRDHILEIIETTFEMWETDDVGFPQIYREA